MEVKIKQGEEMIDATIEMVDGVMVVSPKKVKFEPKDGDVCRSSSCLYIFKTTKPSAYKIHDKVIIYHCCYNVEYNRLRIGEDVGVGHVGKNHRFATEEEKKLLFDKLAEKGWSWDADKKELVKTRWRPEVGETFYRIGLVEQKFITTEHQWREISYEAVYKHEWIFKTKEECDKYVERMNDVFKDECQASCQRLNDAISQVKP